MEIEKELNELERSVLKQRFLKHHIVRVLSKPYCFKVKIFARDYDQIFICTGLRNSYHTLSVAIKFVKAKKEFLQMLQYAVLNGRRVQAYLNLLCDLPGDFPDRFMKLGDCLVQDEIDHYGHPHPSGGINGTEGMHLLFSLLVTHRSQRWISV